MTTLDPHQSVKFEPVSLGRRRRAVDPLVLGILIVVLGVGAAIAKPWSLVGSGGAAAVPQSSNGQARAPSAPPVTVEAGAPATEALTVTWGALAAVVKPHDGWGIRLIVAAPGLTPDAEAGYREHWFPAMAADRSATDVIIPPNDRAALALGLTFPTGQAPLDVRIWGRATNGTWRWLDARPIGRLPAQGGFIFAPPPAASGTVSTRAWAVGEYRIDALGASGEIQHIAVDIPDRYENVRPSSIEPSIASELVPASQVDPSTVAVGAFATIDRQGIALDSVAGPALDEAGSWLDTEIGSGRAPRDRVAVAFLPRATGLGVRLPDGSALRSAALTRLAPEAFATGARRIGGGIIDRRTDDPWVVFPARRGEAWDPGVYRIDVTWADAAGLHDASWHVELRPAPLVATAPLLAIAQAWARYAGSAGLVTGRAEPLEGGPRSSAIRQASIAPRPAGATLDGCPGTVVRGSPQAFGLTYPTTEPLDVLWVRMDDPQRPTWEVPTVQAADAVPGLTIIAPSDGAMFGPGVYYLGLRDATEQRVLILCVGGARPVDG